MRKNYHKKKQLLMIISALLLLFTLFSVIFGICIRGRDKARQEEFEIKISSLSVEKKKLLNEYEQMIKQYNTEAGPSAAIGLVFLDLNEEIYDILYPETKFPATLCMSPASLPGGEGNMSVAQYKELVSNGWKTAVFYDGEGELDEYLEECRATFTLGGFDMPESILFWRDYEPEFDEIIAEYGIEHAIHFDTDDYPIFESSVDEGVWHPGAVSWNDKESQNYLGSLVAEGGHFVYCMGFTYGAETDTLRAERRVSFNLSSNPDSLELSFSNYFAAYKRMMAKLKSYEEGDKLALLTIDGAREHRELYVDSYIKNQNTLELERERIYSEIAIIEKKILEIYEEYN